MQAPQRRDEWALQSKKGTPSGRRVSLFDSLQADLSDPGVRDQNSSFFRATYTPPVRAAAARQI